jgi:hypothetical protein
MNTDSVKVSSLEQYLKIVEETKKKWEDSLWFRGQQRKHWKLLPSILRDGSFSRLGRRQGYDAEVDSEIREEFAIRAPALSGGETVPESDWNLYFLMQHYGVPTRLLDWTESPLIALYFAVRDNPGYYDSAVWILNPYEMNRRIVGRSEVYAPGTPGTLTGDVKRLAPWLPARFTKGAKLPKGPVAVFPTHFARRISSQRSCFTVHGKKGPSFERFQGPRGCLKAVIIPGVVAVEIRLALQVHGIDETMIFPDLEGLGRALATKWQTLQEESAHKNVYARLRPSKLHAKGVGVFAICKILKGTKIFAGENEEILWTPEEKLPKRGVHRKLYDDFCIIKEKRYGSPTNFNRLTAAWFLNESKNPNIACDDNYEFVSLRNIKAGEELTVDYATFSDYPN